MRLWFAEVFADGNSLDRNEFTDLHEAKAWAEQVLTDAGHDISQAEWEGDEHLAVLELRAGVEARVDLES